MTLIYELPPLIKAKIINRPSKTCKTPYIADIRLFSDKFMEYENKQIPILSEETMAHCPSLGCGGLSNKDSIVYVSKNYNTKAKSSHIVYLSKFKEYDNNIIIGINPNICNNIFENILKNNILEIFKEYTIKREVSFNNSRIDFYLEKDDKKIFCEVKNVSLAYYEDIEQKFLKKKDYSDKEINSKIAVFPDCNRKLQKSVVSERALKHINELCLAAEQDFECYLVYIIQRSDVKYFSPSKLDPIYYSTLKQAHINKKINILPIQIHWDKEKAYFDKILDIEPDFINN